MQIERIYMNVKSILATTYVGITSKIQWIVRYPYFIMATCVQLVNCYYPFQTKKDGLPIYCQEFQWLREPVGRFTRLQAYKRKCSSFGKAYLTFKGDQPIVLEGTDSVIKWDITYCNTN